MKKMQINFGGNLMAEVEINNDDIKILKAVNGYGYPVQPEDIDIVEL